MITIILPYYRNVEMLAVQIENFLKLPDSYNLVIIDDGSPEPALDCILKTAHYVDRISVYRITTDIPWNRGGARNLGTHVAKTDWIIHLDIDHVLLPESAWYLANKMATDRGRWYRFPRWRVGKADDTRRKDKVDPECEFAEIHPHVDSYLCTKNLYWRNGGYDEDYSGCLGGGTPFLQELEKISKPLLLPPEVCLHVYTRSVIRDASDWSLSRDTTEFSMRKAKKRAAGNTKPKNPLRFGWEQVL